MLTNISSSTHLSLIANDLSLDIFLSFSKFHNSTFQRNNSLHLPDFSRHLGLLKPCIFLTIDSRFTFRSESIKSTTDESFSCNFIYFNISQYEINDLLLLLLYCNFEINSVQLDHFVNIIIYKMILTIYFSAHISKFPNFKCHYIILYPILPLQHFI